MVERVRAVVLTGFLEVARFVGLDPYEQLNRSGIAPTLLENPENWLAAAPVAQLLERCADEAQRPDFGLLLAESRTLSSLGPLSLLLKHEASLRDIVLRLKEYRRILNDIFNVHLEQADCTAIISLTLSPEFIGPQAVSVLNAVTYRAITEAMDGSWYPEAVHFQFAGPGDTSAYRRFFAGTVEFSCSFNGLSFPASQLDQPNPRADASFAAHAATLLRMLPATRERTIDHVKHALLLLLPNGRSELEAVARTLGIRPRTLQRELANEGHSFAALLGETRRELATMYLKSGRHRVSDIGALIGYSSPSTFSRWFAGEFGVPPAEWRAHNLT